MYTMAYLVFTVAEDREQLRAQRDAFEEQSAQLAAIIDRNSRFDADREARVNRAVDDVEALLVDHFARHDENVAVKLNETLNRIASLLDRPSPIRAAPRPASPSTSTAAPRPAPSVAAPPATTTTTTTPDQRSCAKRPSGPRC